MIVIPLQVISGLLLGSLISSLIGAGASAISGAVNRKAQNDANDKMKRLQNEIDANNNRINLQSQLNQTDLTDVYRARVDNLFARCGGTKKFACGGNNKKKVDGGIAKYYDIKSIYNLINRH